MTSLTGTSRPAICSVCRKPLPPHGAFSVSVSLPAGGPRRWRVCGITCSPACLAQAAAQMASDREQRELASAARAAGKAAR